MTYCYGQLIRCNYLLLDKGFQILVGSLRELAHAAPSRGHFHFSRDFNQGNFKQKLRVRMHMRQRYFIIFFPCYPRYIFKRHSQKIYITWKWWRARLAACPTQMWWRAAAPWRRCAPPVSRPRRSWCWLQSVQSPWLQFRFNRGDKMLRYI